MLIRTILLTLTIILHTAAIAADINRMALSGRRISSVDGLSGNTVYDIVQDKDGFIWMGAAYGLCRYDGYSFVNYYSLSSDPARKIDATTGDLYHDEANGLLWVHTSTYILACYDLTTGRFVDYTGRGDESRTFRRFMRADNGDMWMYDTRSGIRMVRRKDNGFSCTDYNVENGRLPANNVTRMVEDGQHNIWALTTRGLFMIDSTGQTHTVVKDRNYIVGNMYHGNVVCLSEDNTVEMFGPDGRLKHRMVIPKQLGRVRVIRSHFVWGDRWMLFSGDTYSIDLNTWQASKPEELQVSNGFLLDSADGYFFESNSSGRLWVFGPDGRTDVLSLLPDVSFTAERQRKYSIRRGQDGLFYIASYGNGLFIYDPTTKAIRQFSASDRQPVIDNNYLTGILIDRHGNLWVSQDGAGVSLIAVAERSVADFILPAPDHRGDWANCVRMTGEGTGKDNGNGIIILSTKDNKLHTLDMKTGLTVNTTDTRACVMARLTDKDGHTWTATRGDGLYMDGCRFSKYDSGRHIPSNDFYDMKIDALGRVWLASYGNGLIMTRYSANGKPEFRQYLSSSINESRLHRLELDPEGRLWVASSNGLYVVDTRLKDITDNDFACFNTANETFPFDEMRCLRYAAGYLWAGGKGSGLVRCKVTADTTEGGKRRIKLGECTVTTSKEGLADNTVCSIIDDRYGNIWAGTENGLSRIYDHDMKVRTFMFGQMPERNCYSEGCALRLKDGRLLFGTRYGLTVVTPRDNYKSDSKTACVCLTDMRINGMSVCDSNRLEKTVNNMDRISLSHSENTISLAFSNFEYTDIGSALYQYYLEGSDRGWRSMTSINHIEYSNLTPGTYTFHIRALSNNRWSKERSLVIHIRQPWYNTWVAWLIYIAVIATLCFYVYNNARERLRLHQQMELEKQLTEFRLSFFTSITHEFRTPLAIILGAIDKLQEGGGTTSKAAIQTARRGTRRLIRLVNMLMEFRKVNTGHMRLRVEQGDIITFVRDIYQDFWSISRQKEIQTTFTPFARHYEVAFDRQMVETMVYNILSNAVKYTPQKGSIVMTVRLDAGKIVIAVEDSGPGISDDRLKNLFKPFMQGDVSQGGMGIGLYTAHSMAELHKGGLTYRRTKAEGGSTFTLSLPADNSAYAAEDYRKAQAVSTSTADKNKTATEQTNDCSNDIIREMMPEALNDITITIIEDDADMMEQISSETGTYFKTDRHFTGQEGMDSVKKNLPALVICDVMLPDISGYEIVKQLKADAATAHIPIIMLTALDDDNQRMRSYDAGADDYMVKPCNFRLLLARAVQLITKSRMMATASQKSHAFHESNDSNAPIPYDDPQTSTAPPRIITSVADKNFLAKMDMIIAQRISDPELTIDQIAAALNMGRTKFFSKTKALTGVSPNKYLQNERMRIAAELLTEGNLTVAEISYKVGIQDSSYFNKCFKARYSVVPSKYKDLPQAPNHIETHPSPPEGKELDTP